jgi:oligopeptide/dipeptide ABC transporter ATP-binding protein
MALSCTPKLLIADEPTTALDVTIQAQILDLLRDLQKEFQMSIIMITHDLGVVAEICENVVVMYAGKVVEEAPVRGIFNNPQHPYTEGLLRSIPHLGMTSAAKLAVIRGTVPSAVNWPPGCRFAPRCNLRFEKCVEDPPLFDVGGQTAACWLCEGGRRQTTVRSTRAGES